MLVAHLPLLTVILAFSAQLITRLANLLTLVAHIPALFDHLRTLQGTKRHYYPKTIAHTNIILHHHHHHQRTEPEETMKNRRRSSSASRTLDSTVTLVGRIGASLRISSRKKAKELKQLSTLQAENDCWLRSAIERRRSTCSAVFFANNNNHSKLRFAEEDEELEKGPIVDCPLSPPVFQEKDNNNHKLRPSRSSLDFQSYYNPKRSTVSSPKLSIYTPNAQETILKGRIHPADLSKHLMHAPSILVPVQRFAAYFKQKGENSYKLKEKISLDLIWLSSNNCTHSFLIGWPVCNNYIAHFSCESEKNDWFNKLNECIRRRLLRPKSTFIGVAVRIEGRQQTIRQEVQNGKRAAEIIQELTGNLDLPTLDPHLQHYELGFETGKDISANHPSNNPNIAVNNSGSSSLFHQHLHSLSSGSSAVLRALNGVENVYAILMDHVSGLALSETQLTQLDTCPMVNCRLVLRQTLNSGGSSRSSNAALSIVNQFRKVLSRTESSSKRLFGRQLEEGIFRKSPKQATVRVLKTQLDHAQVPDFHQFNVHVTASLLKEYLRSIPGQLLISSNYNLWMDICEEGDDEKKLKMCRNLLKLLPASHTVLLRSIIRLLRQVAASEHSSKMNVRSLAVCIAPSLLENPNIVDSAKRVPELAIYLIEKAADLFDNFAEDGLLPNSSAQQQADENSRRLHLSTDSGLSDDNFNNNNYNYSSVHKRKHAESPAITSKVAGVNSLGVANMSSSADALPKSVSPDSALFENGLLSDCSNCSGDEDKNGTMKIEEIESSKHKPMAVFSAPKPQFNNSNQTNMKKMKSMTNSHVKTKFPNQWKSHIHTNGQVAKPSALSQTKKGNLIHKQQQSSSQEMNSPDLSARADVRVLRLKPNSASPAASPLLNSERFKRINSGNFVSNLDDLRVSDYIRVGGEMIKSNHQNLQKQLSKPSDSTNSAQRATIAAAPATNGLRRTLY
uniref:Rho-GAP domain-containing protein n=1 Tax=Ditylenchus dipsaci TaxID=166011 RepID=A0A915CW72_9BILA